MRRVLEWYSLPSRPKLNVDPNRQADDSFDPDTIDLVQSINLLDLELYRHAQRLLDRLARAQYDYCGSL